METKPILNRWKLFIQWVLVNTIGMIVAAPIITVLTISIITSVLGLVLRVILHPAPLSPPLAPNELSFITQGAYIFGILITILGIVIPSILLGIFQWLVLRKQIANDKKWMLASFIGLSVGLFILVFIDKSWVFESNLSRFDLQIKSGSIGAIIGTSLGIAQWFVLRKYVKFPSLWILGSTTSCLVATNMAWGWPVFIGTSYPSGDDMGAWFILTFVYLLIRLMLIYGGVTGIILVWMFKPSLNELQMLNTA